MFSVFQTDPYTGFQSSTPSADYPGKHMFHLIFSNFSIPLLLTIQNIVMKGQMVVSVVRYIIHLNLEKIRDNKLIQKQYKYRYLSV